MPTVRRVGMVMESCRARFKKGCLPDEISVRSAHQYPGCFSRLLASSGALPLGKDPSLCLPNHLPAELEQAVLPAPGPV